MAEVKLGRVTRYFGRIDMAEVEITQDSLAVGETIHVKGQETDFTRRVEAMQIDGRSVEEVTVGQSVGIQMAELAREHDAVYKVIR